MPRSVSWPAPRDSLRSGDSGRLSASRPRPALIKEDVVIRTIEHPNSWRMIEIATLVAIAFSAWAALGSGSCASCDGAAELLQGKSLATLGVVYYSILFTLAV